MLFGLLFRRVSFDSPFCCSQGRGRGGDVIDWMMLMWSGLYRFCVAECKGHGSGY